MFIINFCLNMFRAPFCPSSGEQRPCVTAYGVMRWFCWMWLVAVVGRCVVGCEHCEGYCCCILLVPSLFTLTTYGHRNLKLNLFVSKFIYNTLLGIFQFINTSLEYCISDSFQCMFSNVGGKMFSF